MRPILVIGSLNMDLVVQTRRVPLGGETVAAQSFTTIPGGKGANQAVAAARVAGRGQAGSPPVFMVGRVGEDAFGAQLIDQLNAEGIDTGEVRRLPGVSTGVALIIVEENGENRILIVAGANGLLPAVDIEGLSGRIQSAGLVLLQFEIPLGTVERAIDLANRHNVPLLLNPAPAYPVPPGLLARVDTLVLNEVESAMLTGRAVTDPASAAIAGRQLLQGRTQLVVITLGARGAVAVTGSQTFHVPAYPVKVVDTTAAGDAFIGALAVALTQGQDLVKSVTYATAAGALAVTRMGAQSSLPTLDEIESFLRENTSPEIQLDPIGPELDRPS